MVFNDSSLTNQKDGLSNSLNLTNQDFYVHLVDEKNKENNSVLAGRSFSLSRFSSPRSYWLSSLSTACNAGYLYIKTTWTELSDWITATKHFPIEQLPCKAYKVSFCHPWFARQMFAHVRAEGDWGAWGHQLKSTGSQQGKILTQFLMFWLEGNQEI